MANIFSTDLEIKQLKEENHHNKKAYPDVIQNTENKSALVVKIAKTQSREAISKASAIEKRYTL